MNSKDLIINALVELYQNGPRDTFLGLCYHIGECVAAETEFLREDDKACVFRAVRDRRDDLFCRWPLRSGSLDYPVPGVEGMAPATAFHDIKDVWYGEYGEKRWALAEFMLRELCK